MNILKRGKLLLGMGAAAFLTVAGAVMPASAHHSFAMFDGDIVYTFTGVLVRLNPDPNHIVITFAPMNEERNGVVRRENGDPALWAVEGSGSAASANQGVTVNSFPQGTVFSVSLHPMRNGNPAGDWIGVFVRCPDGVRPEPGMHCDSVEGATFHGNAEALREQTDPYPWQVAAE